MEEACRDLENLLQAYILEGHIGTGTTSIVRKAIHKESKQIVAIKMIFRQFNVSMARAKNEVEIISRLDHPNIITVYEIYESMEGLCIVMEYMDGGELYERIAESVRFSEHEVCGIMKKLADAVRYCHSMDIVHRDIKPENMLLSSRDPDAVLKLADFGISKILTDELMNTNCGTPVYMAPEIIQGREYGRSVDIWSIGVTMYYLLSGDFPFKGETLEQLAEQITKGDLEFDMESWVMVSFRAKNLVRKLLSINPANRPTAEQILQDLWFIEMDKQMALFAHNRFINLEYVVKKIKKHTMKKKLKKAMNGVFAVVRLATMLGGKKSQPKQIQSIIKIIK